MRILGLLASALTALLLIGACGGGGDAPEMTENDLAEAMLLMLGDFPAGEAWEHEPRSDDDESGPNPFDRCESEDDRTIIGTADSGDFSRSSTSEISQDIRIFNSAESLEKDFDDFVGLADCMAGVVDDGGLDTDSATYEDFVMERVAYREFGDDSRTYRLKLTAALIDEPAVPDPFDIYLDMVFVQIGTVGMRITASDVFDPYDEDEVGRVVVKAEEKVRAALANDPIGSD